MTKYEQGGGTQTLLLVPKPNSQYCMLYPTCLLSTKKLPRLMGRKLLTVTYPPIRCARYDKDKHKIKDTLLYSSTGVGTCPGGCTPPPPILTPHSRHMSPTHLTERTEVLQPTNGQRPGLPQQVPQHLGLVGKGLHHIGRDTSAHQQSAQASQEVAAAPSGWFRLGRSSDRLRRSCRGVGRVRHGQSRPAAPRRRKPRVCGRWHG